MTGWRWYIAIAVVGIAVAMLLPLSPALAGADVGQARFVAAILTVVACGIFALLRRGSSRLLTATSLAAGVAGIGLFGAYIGAGSSCVATYDGAAVLIGGELTPSAAAYVNERPGSSASDLLLDAGGVADRMWTPSSIAFCRLRLTWGGLLAAPLLSAALCAIAARRSFPIAASSAPSPRTAGPGPQPVDQVYDAFISYRHGDPDLSKAQEIVTLLESHKFRAAIDVRDFAPNQHFLFEMERCIRQSRFTLCLVTARYLDSDNAGEEALISKTLDMAERRKRLVPLIFERVDLPVWLYGLVGIDFTASATVDPHDRLVSLLKGTTSV